MNAFKIQALVTKWISGRLKHVGYNNITGIQILYNFSGKILIITDKSIYSLGFENLSNKCKKWLNNPKIDNRLIVAFLIEKRGFNKQQSIKFLKELKNG